MDFTNDLDGNDVDDDDDDDDMLIPMLLLLLVIQPSSSHVKPSFLKALSSEARRRRCAKIRRISLQDPNQSAFWTLFQSGQDDALITLCGFDHTSFNQLHNLFVPFYNEFTPRDHPEGMIRVKNQTGRPRLLCSRSCLALALTWTRTRGSATVLQIIFGMTRTALSIWLRFARRIIVKVLQKHPLAMVKLPSDAEIQQFIDSVKQKYSDLDNCWGAMDGLKLLLEKSGNNKQQNNFYNGWTHDHYVSNLFLFSPDGKIRASLLNAPGVLHDSTLATWSRIYDAISEIYERTGAKVVVDSAFAAGDSNSMIKSFQDVTDRNGGMRQNPRVNRAATSVRQMAEWGMRGLQGSFPRLKDRLLYEERGERKIILRMIVLLYNFRAATVGQNQIRSSFMPYLDRDTNHFAFQAR
jgi:hypothetical protein